MTNSFKKVLLTLAVMGALASPHMAAAAEARFFGPIVPEECKCRNQVGIDGVEKITTAPDFGCVLQTAQNAINFGVSLAIIIFTLMLVVAGFSFMTGGGNPETLSKAKSRFLNIFIGLAVLLCAWLVIDFVMKRLYNDAQFGPWHSILTPGTVVSKCIVAKPPSALTEGVVDVVIPNYPGGGSSGGSGAGTVPTTGGCRSGSCSRLGPDVRCEASGCNVDTGLKNALTRLSQYSGWTVTEAYPPSRSHKASCHSNGTCVDVGLRPRAYTLQNITAFSNAARSVGLRPVFETKDCNLHRQVAAAGINSLCLPGHISADHFSVYAI
jgi:hypothetical protein